MLCQKFRTNFAFSNPKFLLLDWLREKNVLTVIKILLVVLFSNAFIGVKVIVNDNE